MKQNRKLTKRSLNRLQEKSSDGCGALSDAKKMTHNEIKWEFKDLCWVLILFLFSYKEWNLITTFNTTNACFLQKWNLMQYFFKIHQKKKSFHYKGSNIKCSFSIVNLYFDKSWREKWQFQCLADICIPKLNFWLIIAIIVYSTLIGGHGGGCVGCAHPPKNLKSPDTPPCRRQRGCAPYGVGLCAKKKFSHLGVGGGKKNFSAAKRGQNFSRIFFTKILKFF